LLYGVNDMMHDRTKYIIGTAFMFLK